MLRLWQVMGTLVVQGPEDSEARLRLRFYSVFVALAIPLMIGFGIAAFLHGNHFLADPPTEHTTNSLLQKQQQLYDLMKDVSWEGVALGLGGGIALKEGNAELSLMDLIRCFHREARRR